MKREGLLVFWLGFICDFEPEFVCADLVLEQGGLQVDVVHHVLDVLFYAHLLYFHCFWGLRRGAARESIR